MFSTSRGMLSFISFILGGAVIYGLISLGMIEPLSTYHLSMFWKVPIFIVLLVFVLLWIKIFTKERISFRGKRF